MTRFEAAVTANKKRERLELRVTSEQKQLLEHAAMLQGQTLSAFLLESARRAADQAIRDREVIVLSEQGSRAFAEALLNPKPAGPRLREAAKRHRALLSGAQVTENDS